MYPEIGVGQAAAAAGPIHQPPGPVLLTSGIRTAQYGIATGGVRALCGHGCAAVPCGLDYGPRSPTPSSQASAGSISRKTSTARVPCAVASR